MRRAAVKNWQTDSGSDLRCVQQSPVCFPRILIASGVSQSGELDS